MEKMISMALGPITSHTNQSRDENQQSTQYQHQRKKRNSSILRFAVATLASYTAARFFADLLHFRLYVTHERIHIHHFVLGLILMPITWLAFDEDKKPAAEILAGTIAGLFLSEIKQLILEEWGS
jgi:hypothetical protein